MRSLPEGANLNVRFRLALIGASVRARGEVLYCLPGWHRPRIRRTRVNGAEASGMRSGGRHGNPKETQNEPGIRVWLPNPVAPLRNFAGDFRVR